MQREISDGFIGAFLWEGASAFHQAKKGRCKRSGQGKTLDQGATNQRQ
jgi:hypothetical protein